MQIKTLIGVLKSETANAIYIQALSRFEVGFQVDKYTTSEDKTDCPCKHYFEIHSKRSVLSRYYNIDLWRSHYLIYSWI